MTRTTTPDPARSEWGKRVIYVACIALPVVILLAVIFREVDGRLQQIKWDAVILSSSPPMPTADFLREVRALGSLNEQLNLQDETLFGSLHAAFSRHEWVEQVQRVALIPTKSILVELTFRTPVARLLRAGQPYLIDRTGKLLLPLKPEQGQGLVHLRGWEEHKSLDLKAIAWLEQAARVAFTMKDDLAKWSVVSIDLLHRPLGMVDLGLRTQDGRIIIWQRLESQGTPNEESTNEEKVSWVRVYFERYGSIPEGQILDVRQKGGLQRVPWKPGD